MGPRPLTGPDPQRLVQHFLPGSSGGRHVRGPVSAAPWRQPPPCPAPGPRGAHAPQPGSRYQGTTRPARGPAGDRRLALAHPPCPASNSGERARRAGLLGGACGRRAGSPRDPLHPCPAYHPPLSPQRPERASVDGDAGRGPPGRASGGGAGEPHLAPPQGERTVPGLSESGTAPPPHASLILRRHPLRSLTRGPSTTTWPSCSCGRR